MKTLTTTASILALTLGSIAPAFAGPAGIDAGAAAGAATPPAAASSTLDAQSPTRPQSDVEAPAASDLPETDMTISGAADTPGALTTTSDTDIAAQAEFDQKADFQAWSKAKLHTMKTADAVEEWGAETREEFNETLAEAEKMLDEIEAATEDEWKDVRDSTVELFIELDAMTDGSAS